MNKASKLIQIIEDSKPEPNTRQARINPSWDGSLRPTVVFDGETSATTKSYTYLSSYKPAPGDQVAMIRYGRSWVVLGKIVNS
jgi:hypothetical protein